MCRSYHPRTLFPLVLSVSGLLLLTGCEKSDNWPLNERGPVLTKSGLDGSGLPLLEITTVSGKGICSKKEWQDASLSLSLPDGTAVYEEFPVQVKGRGNSTWAYPKKPFNLRFEEAIPLLGMGEATRWCLLANWLDPTLKRNATALHFAGMTALDRTPEFRYVEVLLDGQYAGNYLLTEKVDAAHCPEGILLCLDDHYDETYRFKTSRNKLPVNIILPYGCALDRTAFDAIRDRVNAVEDAIYAGGNWQTVIEPVSFCDMLIVQELSGNRELRWPKSFYVHFIADGRLAAGPAWDFDYGTFLPGTDGILNRNNIWYDVLLSDPSFCALLRERFQLLRPEIVEAVTDWYDPLTDSLRCSAMQNNRCWPVSLKHINYDADLDYDAASDRMRGAILQRLDNLETHFASLP